MYKNKEKEKETKRKYRQEHKEKINDKQKKSHLKRRYGITFEQYNELLVQQGGVCAICLQPETSISPLSKVFKNLAIDHNHKNGEIRALLCSRCNTALGLFNDSALLLEAAKRYRLRY